MHRKPVIINIFTGDVAYTESAIFYQLLTGITVNIRQVAWRALHWNYSTYSAR